MSLMYKPGLLSVKFKVESDVHYFCFFEISSPFLAELMYLQI